VSISLPFLDYGSRRNQIRQAEAAAKAEEQRLLATQNQIRQEVVQALARLSAAQAVVNEFRSGLLDESRKVLEASSKGFELGETTIVSLLEAQRTFRAVQTEYIDALTSHALARVALERAMGTVPASLLPSLDPKEISR
jgi:cobalt-zinc-cadmium efflux system outer membrane protein